MRFYLNVVSFGVNVPFFKSLICIEGHDNGRRFLAISAVLYFLLLALLPVYQKAGVLVLLLLIIATPLLLASSLRRIHDAGFMAPVAMIPTVIFWLNTFALIYLDHSAKWVLLLLGAISTVVISTISNIKIRHHHEYHLGYHGPISGDETNGNNNLDRVEPTLATSVFESLKQSELDDSRLDHSNLEHNDLEYDDLDEHPLEPKLKKQSKITSEANYSFKEQFKRWFGLNKKLALVGTAISFLLILILLFIPNSSIKEEIVDSNDNTQQQSNAVFKKQRLHKLEMPDNFWLMLDQNNALTIGWEGDFKKDGSYWSGITGIGDKTCTELYFSLGANIRTIEVTIKASEDYYADFSPVDTKLIIKSIADKDRFKLCGYEFVLKGTRSLLRNHEFYREYLDVGFNI